MKKTTASPFDDFPQDGTPVQFFERVLLAVNWLEPHLDDNDIAKALAAEYGVSPTTIHTTVKKYKPLN